MALEATVLECPNCGAAIALNSRVCDYCRTPIVVKRTREIGGKNPTDVNKYVRFYKDFLKKSVGEDVETLNALGICLLKLGSYSEAICYFNRAIGLVPENGEPFYYLALAMLHKKRPYLHTLNKIKQIVQQLESALTFSSEGKYYYLLALIQKDFYEKKRLHNGKNSESLMEAARLNEVDDADIVECNDYCGLTGVYQ